MRTIQEIDDIQLLRRFVEYDSQQAFKQLMERHLSFVYAVCRREVRDESLAEDVTQAVFLILARKAASIRAGTTLTGWLFNTARYACKNAMRQEARRQVGEQEVIAEMMQQPHVEDAGEHTWQAIEPLLHDGLATLGTKDREAILLRYFEEKSLKEVGRLIGTSEIAARVRTGRAIEKLKLYLKRHGVVVSSAILASLLTERAAVAAPASFTTIVAQVVSTLGKVGANPARASVLGTKAHIISKGVLITMSLNKIKVAIIIVVLCLIGAGGMLTVQRLQANGSENPILQLVSPARMRSVALANKASSYADKRDFPRAIEIYKEALRIAPNDRMIKFMLAVDLLRAKHRDEAMAMAQELAQIDDSYGKSAKKMLAKMEANPNYGRPK